MTKSIRVPLVQDCSTCIIDSLQTLIPLLSEDKTVQFDLYSLAFKRLAKGFEEREEPAPLSIKLYQDLYKAADNEDPYRGLKDMSIQAALKALPRVKLRVNEYSGYEKLRAALSASITGNIIDFNTAGHDPNLDELESVFEAVTEQGFTLDDSKQLWDILNSKRKTLLFLGDNAGETFFDIPLLGIIKDLGWKITYIVKGRPMVNDATIEDVQGTEIEELAEIRTTGAWAHGTPRQWVSEEFLELLQKSDVVISKGQANIETFPEIQRAFNIETFYILKGKCAHISSVIGAKKGDNIVLHIPKNWCH